MQYILCKTEIHIFYLFFPIWNKGQELDKVEGVFSCRERREIANMVRSVLRGSGKGPLFWLYLATVARGGCPSNKVTSL